MVFHVSWLSHAFSMLLEVRQRLHLELNDAAAAAEITAEVLGASHASCR